MPNRRSWRTTISVCNWRDVSASTLAALLSRVVRDQGRDDEAMEPFQIVAETLRATTTLIPRRCGDQYRAPILARAGEHEEADIRWRNPPLDLLARPMPSTLHADTLVELAHVLELCGRHDEARGRLIRPSASIEVKGDIVSAGRWRTGLTGP